MARETNPPSRRGLSRSSMKAAVGRLLFVFGWKGVPRIRLYSAAGRGDQGVDDVACESAGALDDVLGELGCIW